MGRKNLLNEVVGFADAAGSPATAGYLQRNGADLEFHDGTAARKTANLEAAQSISGAKSFGTGAFKPFLVAQAAQPTPAAGELLIWRDTDDSNRIWLVYNDAVTGVVTVEMT